jgi:hypothetical protein
VATASRTEAEDKAAPIAQLPPEVHALLRLSDALNIGFAGKGLDEACTDEEMAGISGLHAFRDQAVQRTGKANPMVRDFMVARGRGRPCMDMAGDAMMRAMAGVKVPKTTTSAAD